MQVLVIYHSRTGNTRRLAEHIAEGVCEVRGVACVQRSAEIVSRDDFVSADAIIAGSPVYFGTMASELKAVFDGFVDVRGKMGDKIGAAFATSGDISGGKETTVMSILQCMLIYGMIVVGEPLEASGCYGVTCVGVPDERAALSARKLGKRVAALVKTIRGGD